MINFGCKQKNRAVICPSTKGMWSKGTWEKVKHVLFLCHFHLKDGKRRLYVSFSLENRNNSLLCSSFNSLVYGYGCGITFWQRFWLASPFSSGTICGLDWSLWIDPREKGSDLWCWWLVAGEEVWWFLSPIWINNNNVPQSGMFQMSQSRSIIIS